jgi:fructuronate reductase
MPDPIAARPLGTTSLAGLVSRGIAVPAYPRHGPAGVVHLGLGAFHRAHQALVFDQLLAGGDTRWGVLGVAMRQPALADALAAQDGLYSVQLASAHERRWQVSGAIWRTCLATRERQTVVQALAAASTRWVTLTVTEKAYGPELAGLLVEGLAARRAAGCGGLTVASCDNLHHNGRSLQALCVHHARTQDPALAHWIDTVCAFPDSMVDRIVPAGSPAITAQAQEALGVTDRAALRSEVFSEWVIERRFVDATDAGVLASAGVQVVDDVRPYEEAKLRLLNGSHSAMACIGAVAGLPVISDCVGRAEVHQFVHTLMGTDIGPLLQRHDWPAYRDALLARFANPYLQHSVHQIATDSSLKITLRWVPAAVDALHAGRPFSRLAFCAAAWMRYWLGEDEAGNSYSVSDPLAETLRENGRKHKGDPAATFDALGRMPAIWGDVLAHDPAWRAGVIGHLQSIQSHGILAGAALS